MEQRKILMKDGAMVTTEMICSSNYRENWLKEFLQPMCKHGHDMIVGFDTEWSLKRCRDTDNKETQVVLLKLCNQAACLLIKLDGSLTSLIEELSKLLVNKDIIFSGINIGRDLEMLRKEYGLEIRTAVDLSELAADALHQNQSHRGAYNVRLLASEILSQTLKPRPLSVAESDWSGSTLTAEQIEHATVDAYLTNKIAKKLLAIKR